MDIPLLFHLGSSGKILLGSPRSPHLQAFCTWPRWSDLGFSQQEHQCPWCENTQRSFHSLLHWYPPKQTISDDKERIMHLVGSSSFVVAILEKWTVELGSGVGSNLKFKELWGIIFYLRTKPSISVDFIMPWSLLITYVRQPKKVLSFYCGLLPHLLVTLLNYPSKCLLLFLMNLIRTEELKHL